VNSIAWAPHEYGLLLACGSSDGKVTVLECKEDGQWVVSGDFMAHQIGCNAVSWAPSSVPATLFQTTGSAPLSAVKRLVTAGSDNMVKIWA
jgi:protein transport protein SEC13